MPQRLLSSSPLACPRVISRASLQHHLRPPRCQARASDTQGSRGFKEGSKGFKEGEESSVNGLKLPTQGESIVRGVERTQVAEKPAPPDIDYLQELIALQNNGPKNIGFFGTRNMGFLHQNLIEVLAYAMVLTDNHIYTSGPTGTNAAVIRGALRAEKPQLLTVVLPQSKGQQPTDAQELLEQVENIVEMPQSDHLSLSEASRLCNQEIVRRVQQVVCFAFHDSRLLLETCRSAQEQRRIVTLFYLD